MEKHKTLCYYAVENKYSAHKQQPDLSYDGSCVFWN